MALSAHDGAPIPFFPWSEPRLREELMTQTPSHLLSKTRQFETFEQRLVLSGQSIADFTIDPMLYQHTESLDMEIQPMLADTNASSGVNYIHQQYGFKGTGQTVAIIDSGIAWDHYALGGGYGAGYKVVGGWDFAENDANPYDDGPAGFHGTHVAGIVGSTDSVETGVASAVDLVGLRVFNDQGEGYFSWVEQALKWVHQHRNTFANPITTVNLSLGTDWNADTNPGWAMLEDEFAQLEADGIFISVSAGNSFQSYQAPGLSYPATSQYVVPVASHGANGQMSAFSQRNERVIVAPGEAIRSTVPDHLFGGTQTGQFLNASGTSMAAPYLAGASVLVREAFQFMGYESITQDQIYDHVRATADMIWDSSTSAHYHKLNIANAIDALVTDLHGNTAQTATQLGALQSGTSISGIIGKLNDTDHFKFTAQQNGTVTFTINSTHDLDPAWNVSGASFQVNGNQLTFNVQAGQQYSLSLGTNAGLGHYDIAVNIQSTFNPEKWGVISSKLMNNLQINGERWIEVSAMRNGTFTVEALFAHNNGNVNLEVYDQSMNLRGTATSSTDNERLDLHVNAGDKLYIRATGSNNNVSLKLTNLVQLNQGVLNVHGTNSVDTFNVNLANGYSVVVNGTAYHYGQSSVQTLRIIAHGGNDFVNLTGTAGNEVAYMSNQFTRFANTSQTLDVIGSKNVVLNSGGGVDQVSFMDTAGNDLVTVSQTTASMTNSVFQHQANGFTRVFATATQGHDTATLIGTADNDVYQGRQNSSTLLQGNRVYHVTNFDNVNSLGNGGFDRAFLYDSSGKDTLTLSPVYASMSGVGFKYTASGFRDIRAFSTTGGDQVNFNDSVGDDSFYSQTDMAFLRNNYFANYAFGFHQVIANAVNGGHDTAIMSDSNQNDTFYAYSTYSIMVNQVCYQRANGFEHVTALANQSGTDVAYLHGTTGSESVTTNGNTVTMVGSGFKYHTNGFETNDIRGGGGVDFAMANGTNQVDNLYVNGNHTQLWGTGYHNHFREFKNTLVDTKGGADLAVFEEFGCNDSLSGSSNELVAKVNQSNIRAWGLAWLDAYSKDDEVSNDEIGAVDYLFALHGQWQ
jgi:hypothetical protein